MPKEKPVEKKRSYNVREFKKYPKYELAKKQTRKFPPSRIYKKTADQIFCPICNTTLSNCTGVYNRTIHDIQDGKYVDMVWDVYRRYCIKCKKQISPHVPGALPKQQYSVDVAAKASFLNCEGLSTERIQNILESFFNIHIPRSTLVHLCHLTATQIRSIYERNLEKINEGRALGGDETGWFVNGQRYYVWAIVTELYVFFSIKKTRSSDVPKELLKNFKGITNCDSYGGWNDIGKIIQRCLIHYYRDLYRTAEKNDSAEYNLFFNEFRAILDDAVDINSEIKDKLVKYPYDSKSNTKRLATLDEIISLFYRLDKLINHTWIDKDCKRYIKRLKREKNQLFVFLEIEGIDYHNNATEREIREISRRRKILFGNRTEKGAFTTETLMSIRATCRLRGVDFYQFLKDYLNGKISDIPIPISA